MTGTIMVTSTATRKLISISHAKTYLTYGRTSGAAIARRTTIKIAAKNIHPISKISLHLISSIYSLLNQLKKKTVNSAKKKDERIR